MKILILILTVLLISTGWSYNQTTEEDIEVIKVMYKNTRDNYKTYDTTIVYVWDDSTEGAQVTGYYNDGDLKLMEVWDYGDTKKSKTEFYYNNGQLFFVFNVEYKYTTSISREEQTNARNHNSDVLDNNKTVVLENKYYFKNDQIIRAYKRSKQRVKSNSENYKDKEPYILKIAEKMKSKLVR